MIWRLGLQKRIMLYVAVGLLLMFGVIFYFGMQAVRRSTDLVFAERLAVAEGVAAAIASDFAHVIRDVSERATKAIPDGGRWTPETVAQEVEYHLAEVDVFAFFKVSSVWLLDDKGHLLAAAPAESVGESQQVISTLLAKGALADSALPALWRPVGQSGSFVAISVPLKDMEGERWAWAVVNTEGFNASQPFVPFGLVNLASNDWQVPTSSSSGRAEYHLEVIAPNGVVALGVGPDENVGRPSPHLSILGSLMGAKDAKAMLHDVNDGKQDHVLAAVPVPLSDLYLVLEQSQDVALALPKELRRNLLAFSTVGFLLTLIVAWVTTRHVVKPTEQLTAAAHRIAQGEVDSPITVVAQDEVGKLAESLETMRLRLQTWGSELEKQVKERTRELEARNRELNTLYKTLQHQEQQLRVLLGKVLGAQEEERTRVARELHDGIGQAVSALAMGLERLEQSAQARGPDVQEQARLLEALAKETVSDLRRLTIALRPAALGDLGLVPAIRRYAELCLEPVGIRFEVQERRLDIRLDPSVETVVYRVVQEAINNVARHSGASLASIVLEAKGETMVATVQDNGCGFDPTPEVVGRGLGLQGMQERASLASGRLTVDSQPGRGTTVCLELPVEAGAKRPSPRS